MLQDTTAGVTATAEILRSNSLSTRLQTRTAARPGATCLLHSWNLERSNTYRGAIVIAGDYAKVSEQVAPFGEVKLVEHH